MSELNGDHPESTRGRSSRSGVARGSETRPGFIANRHSPARIIAILTLLVAAYGIALPMVPLAISTLAPPVRDFRITRATRLSDGRVRLTAHVEKRHCVFTALRFTWRGVVGEAWRVGYTTTDQPEGADTDRPAGRQSLGPWIVASPPTEQATILHIAVRHRCGPFAVVTKLAQVTRKDLPLHSGVE